MLIPNPRHRIVSLLPSATEIVCALGAEAELVGISHECDFPASIRDRAVLTSSRLHAGGSSRDIDGAVRGLVRDALSIYAVDDAKLAALAPDVIVTQDLCEVCAVSLDDVRAAVARLALREAVQVISLSPTTLHDVLDDVVRVARGIGRTEAGIDVRAALSARIETITGRAKRTTKRPRVASIEWIEPLMLGGTWMPELIERAGGIAVGASHGGPAPTVTPAGLAALAPDVVVIKPCGFSVERTLQELSVIERDILGVLGRQVRVYVTDGNAFFNRPGPRLVESLEILAACIHPEAFGDLVETHGPVIVPLRS